MDSIEPQQTPFSAVTAHTSRLQRVSISAWVGERQFTDQIENSNTKHGWTNRHHMCRIGGWELSGYFWSSSRGYLSHKDGILVGVLCISARS